MTKSTNMHQLINNILIIFALSETLTILVKTLKPEQLKPTQKLKEEEGDAYVPNIVIVKNRINNNKGGQNEVTRECNRKATSFGKVTITIVLEICNQKITTSRHSNIFAKPTTTDLNKKAEKKKKKKNQHKSTSKKCI